MCRSQQLTVRSHNISSWHRHADDFLQQAAEDNVHLLFLQEVNLTPSSAIGATHEAARLGWQLLVVPKPATRNGGVAIFVRKPLGLLELSRKEDAHSQTLTAQLLGLQANLVVCTHYNVPDACPSHLHHLSHDVDALHGTPWLLGMDGNVPMTSGPWASAMNLVGACLRATARHVRSSQPIDGIWSSENCVAVPNSAKEMRATGGDHTVAQVSFKFEIPSVGTEWRLARAPQENRQTEVHSLPWAQVASADSDWQQALLSIDTAWDQWCSDTQAWLELTGVISSSSAERPLGSTPTVRHGNHKIASKEGCAERKIRRAIRRLQEARNHQLRGRQVPQDLRNAIRRSAFGP